MGLGPLLTLIFIIVMVIFILFRLRAAGKEATLRDERQKKEKAREKRQELEQDLLQRLERLKERDDLQAAKDAIHKDPKRAAKVISKMMRDK